MMTRTNMPICEWCGRRLMPIVGPATCRCCRDCFPSNEESKVRRGDEIDDIRPTLELGAAYRVVSVTSTPTKSRRLFGVPCGQVRRTVVIHLETIVPFGNAPVSLPVSTDDNRCPYNVGDYVALKLTPVDAKRVLPPFRRKRFGES